MRVSHFAHDPDPDGLLPECGRRSRDVTSADHLYVRAATQTWLRRQGHQPRYRYAHRNDAPVGPIVEIELDGHTLLVHMDPTAPPDWDTAQAGDIILGPGVSIDHRTLVRRGYVHHVQFVSEGNERVMTLGTELPWIGTDWDFELADCTVGEDGRLITPVVTRVEAARAARERAPVPQPRQEKAERPVQIGALTRQIGSAVQKKEFPAVRELLNTARLQVPRCEGQALEHLRRAIDRAQDLLSEQDRIRRGLFVGLGEAVRHGHVVTVTKLTSQARKLLDHDVEAAAQEAGILQAADAFLEQARLDRAQKRREEDARRAAEAEEWRRRRDAAATREQQAPLVAQAQERRARNRARGQVQGITGRLRREAPSAQQQRELVQELTVAAKNAGDLLSEAEQDKVQKWTTKSAAPVEEPGTAEDASPVVQPRREVAAEPATLPDRLAPAVAAVRGALKKGGPGSDLDQLEPAGAAARLRAPLPHRQRARPGTRPDRQAHGRRRAAPVVPAGGG